MRRRTFLQLTTAAGAAALAAPYVHAQSKKFADIILRINGYGGFYDESFMKSVGAPLEEKYGLKIQFNSGSSGSDLIKLIANKDNPPYDMYMADSAVMVELLKAGVIDEIKASDVPNVNRILPGFREYGDYGVPFNVASVIPVYNSKYVKPPLTSYSDIARPDLKGHVVIPATTQDTSSLYLLGLAEENGGSIANMEPAFHILAAAKPNIVALTQTNVAAVQMFQRRGLGGQFLGWPRPRTPHQGHSHCDRRPTPRHLLGHHLHEHRQRDEASRGRTCGGRATTLRSRHARDTPGTSVWCNHGCQVAGRSSQRAPVQLT